ncbi:hypothetical protein Musp01_32130 [Muricauda sp. NBRC 101325]|nr:hypothetical protein Musp01_32130 [Muricauda sp. NBRC 101325]
MVVLFVTILTNSLVTGQESYTCSGYEKGTLTLKSGKSIDTYIYIDYCNPHRFQSGLSTIDEKTFKQYASGKKIKNKSIETYKEKDVVSIALENGKRFKRITYVDTYSGKKIDLLPQRFILEQVTDGKIKIYKRYYRTQNGFIYKPVSESWFNGGEDHYNFMTNNFEILVQTDEDKNPRNIWGTNLKTLFGDNEEVMAKFLDGGYEFREKFQEPAAFAANCDTAFFNALMEMVNDYNGVDAQGAQVSQLQIQ